MSKLLSIIFLSLLSVFTLQDNQIFIESNLPGEIYPGDTYTVEFTIHKQDLKHYAILTQQLPIGFSVIERQSGAANFSFTNREVKYTWLKLPETSPITLSYDIVADKRLNPGVYNLPAKFVYMYRNLRGSVSLNNSTVKVYREGERFDSEKMKPKESKKIQVLRFAPEYSPEKKALIVQLMISRGDITGKAKIVENIPQGYKVKAIETKGAHFQLTKNNVEFIWNKLPKSNNFVISYLLSPHNEKSPLPDITGIFRFLQGGTIMGVVTKQVDYKHIRQDNQKQDAKKDTRKDVKKDVKKEVIDYFGY